VAPDLLPQCCRLRLREEQCKVPPCGSRRPDPPSIGQDCQRSPTSRPNGVGRILVRPDAIETGERTDCSFRMQFSRRGLLRRTSGELSANLRRTWTSGQNQRFSCHGPSRSAQFMAVEMGERAGKLGVSMSRSRVGEFWAERGDSVGGTNAFGAVFGPLSRGLWRGRDCRLNGAKTGGKGREKERRRELTLSASRVNCWGGRSAPDRQAPRARRSSKCLLRYA
jgi:hypothetical protein